MKHGYNIYRDNTYLFNDKKSRPKTFQLYLIQFIRVALNC